MKDFRSQEMRLKDEENGRNFEFRKHPYVCWILFLILIGKMTNQWARKFISYSFGFSVGDGMPGSEFYEISSFYP
jgi:hypothetical protein